MYRVGKALGTAAHAVLCGGLVALIEPKRWRAANAPPRLPTQRTMKRWPQQIHWPLLPWHSNQDGWHRHSGLHARQPLWLRAPHRLAPGQGKLANGRTKGKLTQIKLLEARTRQRCRSPISQLMSRDADRLWLRVLGNAPNTVFDELVRLTAKLFGIPARYSRSLTKAAYGVKPLLAWPEPSAYCQVAILNEATTIRGEIPWLTTAVRQLYFC